MKASEHSVIVLGRGGVGKGKLVQQFVQQINYYTIRKLLFLNKQAVLLDIFDSPDFDDYREMCLVKAESIILTFSITDRKSFEQIENYHLPYVRTHKHDQEENEDFTIVLVGNKCDLEHERVVSPLEAKNLAAKYGWKYFETSATMRANVDEMFMEVAADILQLKSQKRAQEEKKCIIQ